MSDDYDLGYFEGIRNAMMAFIQDEKSADCVFFFGWLENELEDAKRLRDGD